MPWTWTLERTGKYGSLEVWQMDLGSLPLPQEQRPALAAFLTALLSEASTAFTLTPTVWLEATHIHLEGATRLLAPNARAWILKTGFGIYPDGEAPRMWNDDDFSGAAFGSTLPLFNNQIFEISRQQGHLSAIQLMAGRAILNVALLAGTPTDYKRHMLAVLKPLIQERAFHAYPFFFPLLTAASVRSPEIASWLGEAKVYMREIFDEGRLLILTTVSLDTCFERAGATFVSQDVLTYNAKESLT